MYTVQYMSPYITYLPGQPWTSLTTHSTVDFVGEKVLFLADNENSEIN